MAKPWYWDDQFNRALPKYLAKWYVITHIRKIEKKCREMGISPMMKVTNGYYSIDQIGHYIVCLDKSYDKLLNIMKKSKDPIVQDLYTTILSRVAKRVKPLNGVNVDLTEALIRETGKAIQNTDWWNESIGEIRKLSSRTRIVQRVMES